MPDDTTSPEPKSVKSPSQSAKKRSDRSKRPLSRNPAKIDANLNATWKAGLPGSRKRTSSTIQVPEQAKKPRAAVAVESDAEDDITPELQPKVKSAKPQRKYAAPAITIDLDESEPTAPVNLHEFSFYQYIAKSKTAAGKVKQLAKKAFKIIAPGKSTKTLRGTGDPVKASTRQFVPAKIVADSASEVEASDSGDKESDSEFGDFEDAEEEEFLAEVHLISHRKDALTSEVPHVVSKKVVTGSEHQSDKNMEMRDAGAAGELFDSDQESYEIDKPPLRQSLKSKQSNASTLKSKASNVSMRSIASKPERELPSDSDEEEDFPDAPPRRYIPDLAPPKRSAHDEDIAMHEAIADALNTTPILPTEDLDIDTNKKPHKVSAARQRKADLEKPHIRAVPVPQPQGGHQIKLEDQAQAAAASNPAPRAEDSWHISASIAYPAPGKKVILLNSQTEEVQRVLRDSIGLVKIGLLHQDAYPPIISRAGFARAYLVSAADALPDATHIRDRLGTDLKYAAILADILLDRINILRGDIKRTATNVAPGYFRFARLTEAKSKELVEKLLKDHRYIFPVDPQTVPTLDHGETFPPPGASGRHQGRCVTRNFKAHNMHLFNSSSKKHPKQLELPDAMVALAATAYRTTGERQTIAFTEGAYEDTYRNHMKTLSDTRDAAPVALHKVLHGLFNEVTDGKATQPEAGSSATLINLVEVPESD
ncbi:hypothetical protein B0H13DRAFT_2363317 [Mycena leptocephala]|nr:hypothetical protein B0H13DRAFT_2363317 [Mycena leptocephala]